MVPLGADGAIVRVSRRAASAHQPIMLRKEASGVWVLAVVENDRQEDIREWSTQKDRTRGRNQRVEFRIQKQRRCFAWTREEDAASKATRVQRVTFPEAWW